jgi:hypothetical protein
MTAGAIEPIDRAANVTLNLGLFISFLLWDQSFF